MTIAKYISEFLSKYENIKIDTNHIQDGSDKYGLFKSPGRTVVNFIDESYTITENYQFFAKQNSNSEYDRSDSDVWLEDIAYWVDDYPWENDYPTIDGDRKVLSIQLTGNPYPMESDGKETLYQMSLTITYIRKRKE